MVRRHKFNGDALPSRQPFECPLLEALTAAAKLYWDDRDSITQNPEPWHSPGAEKGHRRADARLLEAARARVRGMGRAVQPPTP